MNKKKSAIKSFKKILKKGIPQTERGNPVTGIFMRNDTPPMK